MTNPDSLHYDNAPIVEAVIELQVEPAATTTMDTVMSMHERVRGDYPTVEAGFEVPFVAPQGAVSATVEVQPFSFAFKSADDLQVVQVRQASFALSRLQPYERWAKFAAEALRLWPSYVESTTPKRVTRVGVRTINRIDIPLPAVELNDYLLTKPDIGSRLSQVMNNYFFQLQLPVPDYDCQTQISQTLVPPPIENGTSVLMDIDTYRLVDIPLDNHDALGRCTEVLADLHDAKNFIFEGCITDKVRELIS